MSFDSLFPGSAAFCSKLESGLADLGIRVIEKGEVTSTRFVGVEYHVGRDKWEARFKLRVGAFSNHALIQKIVESVDRQMRDAF